MVTLLTVNVQRLPRDRQPLNAHSLATSWVQDAMSPGLVDTPGGCRRTTPTELGRAPRSTSRGTWTRKSRGGARIHFFPRLADIDHTRHAGGRPLRDSGGDVEPTHYATLPSIVTLRTNWRRPQSDHASSPRIGKPAKTDPIRYQV